MPIRQVFVAALVSVAFPHCMPAVTPAHAQAVGTESAGAIQDGTRYGQAAGAALVCYGLKTTLRMAPLRAKYQGSELAAFDAQAGKVLDAWQETLSCRNSGGPNPCKLSHVWSCQEALREIGPNGTAIPGLVEPNS